MDVMTEPAAEPKHASSGSWEQDTLQEYVFESIMLQYCESVVGTYKVHQYMCKPEEIH